MRGARLVLVTLFASVLTPLVATLATGPAAGQPTWRDQVDATPGYSHATDAVVAVDGAGRVTVATQVLAFEEGQSFDQVVVASRDVGDPGFAPEQVLAADDAWSPDVATNSAGLTAVAFEDDSAGSVVRVAVRMPEEALFAAPVPVSAGDVTSFTPRVVVSEAGAVTVVWQVYDPFTSVGHVQVATRAAGGTTWTEPADLTEPVTLGVDDLAVGVDGDGLVTAAWKALDHAYAVTGHPGAGAWPEPEDLTPAGGAGDVRLGVGRDGTTAVGWLAGSYPSLVPWLAVRGPGGSFVADPVEDAPSEGASGPEPAVAPNGEVTATWLHDLRVRVGGPAGEGVQTVSADEPWTAPRLAASDDVVVVVWTQRATDGEQFVVGAHRIGDGSWSEVDEVTPDVTGADEEDPVIAIDAWGDATVAYRDYDETRPTDHNEVTGTVLLDSAGPRLTWSSAGPGTAGTSVPLAVTAEDWSGPVEATWAFGDGTSGTGLTTSHTYAAAGTYPVTVTATDAVGNSTSATRHVTVGAAPSPLPADTTAPVLSATRLDPRRLPTGHGARLEVTTTENARLAGVVQRRKDGRWRGIGAKHWGIQAGANSERFYGKAAQRRLTTGRYRVLLTATDAAGNASAVATARFRVDRGSSGTARALWP